MTDPTLEHRDYLVRELESAADFEAALELQTITWGADFSERVPAAIMKVAQRVGGVAAGAFTRDGAMLGLVFGLTGMVDGQLVHWSDLLAVKPACRNQGIGEALKRHQRNRLLQQNVRRMHWTFDPLESRNAHFNFNRLGVIAHEYVRDLYGDSNSPLHAGIGTDRLIVEWPLDSERVVKRLADGAPPLESMERTPLVNPPAGDNLQISSEPQLGLEARTVRITIPPDIQSLKSEHPETAHYWRIHTRAAFEHYLGRGYRVIEFRTSFYILTIDQSTGWAKLKK